MFAIPSVVLLLYWDLRPTAAKTAKITTKNTGAQKAFPARSERSAWLNGASTSLGKKIPWALNFSSPDAGRPK